jgi:hypothetical protein
LSTRCVRNRIVASLSTSCNNVVILSSCYKVVTHNLLNCRTITSCWNNFVTSLSSLLFSIKADTYIRSTDLRKINNQMTKTKIPNYFLLGCWRDDLGLLWLASEEKYCVCLTSRGAMRERTRGGSRITGRAMSSESRERSYG